MTYVLGISGFYHDSAAAIIEDGQIIAAAQEERFTRKKHDPRFPKHAISYCLEEAFIEASDLDAVVFYDNSALTIDRIVRNSLSIAPKGREGFQTAIRSVLGDKIALRKSLHDVLGEDRPLWFVDHHMSHAASAFYPSPFEEAAMLTIDGVGEHATLSIGHGKGSEIELLQELVYPHSLGLLYSAITAYCGFKVNSGEYKLMGLAPYGQPKYADLIEKHLIDIREDGSFALNMDYFAFPEGEHMTNEKFHELFGEPPRMGESSIELRHMDIAASIQNVTEKIVLKLAAHAQKLTGSKNLVMAGGVALNCVANGHLHRAGIFENIWIQPAAGDAGGALGAALYAAHTAFNAPRTIAKRGVQRGSYLGPSYSSEEITSFLDRRALPYEQIGEPDVRAKRIAEAIDDGLVVGYFQGRMEFGPRSLGARSIIGDPRSTEMQSKMNLSIKYRESFRPFAPAVMFDKVEELFEHDAESPYMLMVAPVREGLRVPFDLNAFRESDANMLDVVNKPRSTIPAITHVDYSARLQTVHPDDNPEFYRLLQAFDKITQCPVLINTSFNVRGEPIVMSPEDAVRCFFRTGIDLLVLEDCLLWKKDQPEQEKNDDWKNEFELD
ncbi:MAG: carbamoyltransferase [Rhizobiaceae bacterium]|nr:carbamoyltransferase [Rhizobiaceae bacterium]